MNDIKTPSPSDAEIAALYLQETGFDINDSPAALLDFARACVARWGTQPAGEPVDRADAVNLARNALTQYDCAITKKGVRVLAEAVLSMDAALASPHPAPVREPQFEMGRGYIERSIGGNAYKEGWYDCLAAFRAANGITANSGEGDGNG